MEKFKWAVCGISLWILVATLIALRVGRAAKGN
jgi:hypothetical protein